MEGWISVDITMPLEVDELALDLLSGALFEAGVAGIEVRDQSSPTVVVASFSPDIAPGALHERVEPALAAAGITPGGVEVRSEQPIDWATHWRRSFEPIDFGALWVVPTWLEPPAGAEHVLRIDPGMAFGTGRHETTALCMERIAELRPGSILDVGTGTGILAMGALLLGTQRAVGTDNDPDALIVARENAALNGFADRLVLRAEAPDALGERFDVVVANILRDPLIALAPAIRAAVASGGHVVLSGLLGTQVEAVQAAYVAAGLSAVAVARRGEWARVDLCAA